MKLIHKIDRYISIGFIATIITVVCTSYFTFKEVIDTHNEKHRQATAPLFSLVNSEIIRPLAIAKFMAINEIVTTKIEEDTLDKVAINNYLNTIDQTYGLRAFIAIEKHNLLLSSGREELSLRDDKAEWYHRLKVLPQLQFTDIGNADDPHLYFDHKIINEQDEFAGFTGVAVDLTYFAETFAKYQQRFGFELFFVNDNNEVMLSSTKLMKTVSHHRKESIETLDDFPWYQEYLRMYETSNFTRDIVSFENQESVITTMPLKDLQWRVFVVYPPATKQSEYWQLFFSRFSVFMLVTLTLYMAFFVAMKYMKRHLLKDSETDYLTQLPNRSYVHWKFNDICESHDRLCVVVADIDNFKLINDNYGHLVGDNVIKLISEKLTESLRKQDVTGRWGGEEFIMLLPDTSAEQAFEITERMRSKIESTPYFVNKTSSTFYTTVSFGIAESGTSGKRLVDIVDQADNALYQAKSNGRNQIVIFKNAS